MELDVREQDGKLIVAPSERNHTMMTLLKQPVWDAGGKAGYNQGHPYEGSGGELVIEAEDPEEVLEEAVETVRDELEEFKDAF
ncbi:MAG: hypothetical protein MUP63_01345 [Candidatus Nanohaloarchaeota archaeon QJJ-7]|nr:hypothetical protein [Candidatus Nanohaloarchaeota archaeon QJJ-7]